MNNKDNNLKVNNDFYLDLLEQCNKYKVKDNVLERIKDECSQFFLDIKVFLYEKLSKEDKDILLRYFSLMNIHFFSVFKIISKMC